MYGVLVVYGVLTQERVLGIHVSDKYMNHGHSVMQINLPTPATYWSFVYKNERPYLMLSLNLI